MVSSADEPIALSKAIQGMIKSVNSNSRLLKENNNDLIAGLSALKVTIQQAFLGLKTSNNSQKSQRATVLRDEGINTPSALLRNINSSILQQSGMLKTYLQDVPFLTSATARHETEKFRQTLLDQIKKLALSSDKFNLGGGSPNIPGGAARRLEKDAVNAAEDAGEGALGGGAVELEQAIKKPGFLKRLLLRGGGLIGGAGMLGGRIAVGAGGAYLAYNGLSNINPNSQKQQFFGGKNGIVGSTAGNYAQSIAGGAMLGASIGGPWGALIGGGVGLGAALYREFQPQIDDFLGHTFDKVKNLTSGVMGWFEKHLPSWDQVKDKVNAVGFDVELYVGKFVKSIQNFSKSVQDWLNKNLPLIKTQLSLGKADFVNQFNTLTTDFMNGVSIINNSVSTAKKDLDSWANKNIPGWKSLFDPTDPATIQANATTAANSTTGMPTSEQRNMHQGIYDKVQTQTNQNNSSLTKVLGGLLDYLIKTNLKAGGNTLPGGYSLDSYQTSGNQNQMMPGIIQAAYTSGGNTTATSNFDPQASWYNLIHGNTDNSVNSTPTSDPGNSNTNTPSYTPPTGNNTTYTNTALPRPVRNNNPFDLDYVKGQVGLQPDKPNDGRFGIYTSMEAGVASAVHQLKLHPDVNTVNSIEKRYGPSSENDTSGNIKKLSAYLGSHGLSSDPNAKINYNDPKAMEILIAGLAQIEMGAKDQMQYVPYSTIKQGVALAEGRMQQDTPQPNSTAIATAQNPSAQNLSPAERPKDQTQTAKMPTNPAGVTQVLYNPGAPPMSNQIPMHITGQGLIIVNHLTSL